MGHDEDIAENKAEIKALKALITASQTKESRSDRDDKDIARWSTEIEKLNLENQILELKQEIKEMKTTPNYGTTEDYKEMATKLSNKEKLLDEITRSLIALLIKSVSVDEATTALEVLALNQQKPHVERVIALIKSKHKPGTENPFIPSNYATEWPSIDFVLDGKSIVETHRPPFPNKPSGHRHVTLTSEALGKLYDRFCANGSVRTDCFLLPEDYELAQEVSEVAVKHFEKETDRLGRSHLLVQARS